MSISGAEYTAWLGADGQAREILVEAGCHSGGAEITRYLSRYGYTTGAGDTPASTGYAARLAGSITLSRQVAVGRADPAVSLALSGIELDNTDGALDEWLDDVWSKRPVRVYIGSPAWPRADFRQIFAGRAVALTPAGRGGLRLEIFDEMQRLNCPVSEATLGGSGVDKEALIPLAFGECFNVSPLLRDAATHEYQVHGGAIEGVIEARENGAPVPIVATPASGRFTLTGSPAGAVTCDVQGATAGGTYVATVASIVREIVTAYGDAATRLSADEIDAANFAAFDAANPQTVGLYLRDRINVLDACGELAASVQSSLYFSRAGQLRLWRPPVAAGAAVMAFGVGDMEAGSFAAVERLPAQPAVTLGWGRNWTPQQQLSGGLPESSSGELQTEWRETTVQDAAAVALHRYTARPQREDTLLVSETDAAAEAGSRLSWRAAGRTIVEFVTTLRALELEPGDDVTITYPRFGCASGKTGWVIGIEEQLGAANSPFRVKLEAVI